MKVLVTGGAGFIGSHIVDQLLAAGHQVVVIDNLSSGKKGNLPETVTVVEADISEDDISPIFQQHQFDAVIHQAAQVSVPHSIQNPELDLRVNVLGTLRVLENIRRYHVQKIIFASSAALYGRPDYLPVREDHPIQTLSPYGVNKWTAENYIRIYHELYGIRYTIFRYANVYGPRQSIKSESGVITIFVDALAHGVIPTIFGDGSDTRDYVYVGDVARANVLALTSADNQVLHVSQGEQVDLITLYKKLTVLFDIQQAPKFGPVRPGDIAHSALSRELIHTKMGWEPHVSLDDGLATTVAWAKTNQK